MCLTTTLFRGDWYSDRRYILQRQTQTLRPCSYHTSIVPLGVCALHLGMQWVEVSAHGIYDDLSNSTLPEIMEVEHDLDFG